MPNFIKIRQTLSQDTGSQQTDRKQDMICTCKLNIEARSCNQCCSRKAISITYSECVLVALFNQHAKRMRRNILSCVTCRAVPYFSTSHKWHNLGKTLLNIKCVFRFSLKLLSETLLIPRRI